MTFTDEQIEAVSAELWHVAASHEGECTARVIDAATRLILEARADRYAAQVARTAELLNSEMRTSNAEAERDAALRLGYQECQLKQEAIKQRDAALATLAKYRNMAPYVMVNKVEPELARELPANKRTSTVGALVDRIAALEAENAELRKCDLRRVVPFVPAERIAENERLRVALDEYVERLRQRYTLGDDEDFPDGESTPSELFVIEELHAAMKGK